MGSYWDTEALVAPVKTVCTGGLKANIPEPEFIEPENTEQPGPKSNRLLDLGSTAATCPPTKDSRLGSSERSANEVLGTDRI